MHRLSYAFVIMCEQLCRAFIDTISISTKFSLPAEELSEITTF